MGFYLGNDYSLDFLCSLAVPAHYMRLSLKKAAYAVMPSAAYRKSRSDATLQRFVVWGIQGMLKLLHEVCHMQAVDESVVCMDRHRHGAASIRFGNFAEGDAGRGVGVGKVPRMRDGGEVKPGKDGITDQVGVRIAFDVIPLTHPVEFDGRHPHELVKSRMERIVSQANGAVRASYSAAAIDLFVEPDTVVDNARPEVLNLVRSDQGPVQQ
jgi:hypothetical protein